MPFVVKEVVSHDGREFRIPDVVSDDLGNAILAEHPHAVVRIAYDLDLCANMIEESSSSAPAPVAPVMAPRQSAASDKD